MTHTPGDWSKHDRIISELVTALAMIMREVHQRPRHYIEGMAEQAIKNCDAQRERNKDGYLVVKPDWFPGTEGTHYAGVKIKP